MRAWFEASRPGDEPVAAISFGVGVFIALSWMVAAWRAHDRIEYVGEGKEGRSWE